MKNLLTIYYTWKIGRTAIKYNTVLAKSKYWVSIMKCNCDRCPVWILHKVGKITGEVERLKTSIKIYEGYLEKLK